MEVKITNEHLNNSDDDLLFHQPKYHFGQLLTYGKDKQANDRTGIVVQMRFTGEWNYSLLNLETLGVTDWYEEDQLTPAQILVSSS